MGKGREERSVSWITGLLPALAAGLGLRFWYYLDLAGQPFFNYPIVDSLTYDRMALAILSGEGGSAFARPPLYPYFLSFLYALGGHHQGVVAWAQFLLGLAAVVPVYLLAERWFGRRAAALTAWACALYPLRIFFEGEILGVTLFGFFLSWGMWFLWRGMEGGGGLRYFLAGLFFGLGVLTRPNFLLALPLVAAGGVLAVRGSRLPVLRGTVFLGAAVLLCLLPATLHNWRAERELIPVAGNGGINFFLGNRPGSTGETPLPPGLLWQETVLEPIRLGLTGRGEQDRYWWQRSREYIADDFRGWLQLMAGKARLFWTARESSNNKNLGFFAGVSPVVRHYRWWFGVLFCLAWGSLFLLPLRPGPLLVGGLLVGYWVAVTVFFITARYRLPLVPFVAMLSAAGVSEAMARWGAGGRKRVLWALTAALIAGAMVFPPWRPAAVGRIDPDFQMGQVYLGRGEPREAEERLLQARERDPWNPDVYNSLGAARYLAGDLSGAEDYYLRALRFGRFSEVYFNLGVVYERMGETRHREAVISYRRSIERNPLEMRARVNLEGLTGRRLP